jgi:alpha-amylase
MLRVSAKLAALRAQKLAPKAAGALEQATEHLLRAQCNDAYWHGVFGGLYSPHLRTSLWRDLVAAEGVADGLAAPSGTPQVERLDFDADGAEEVLVSAAPFSALFKPADGATLAALDFRPASATLVNSIMRRPEAYHARLREAAQGATDVVASIHEQLRVKEPGLERHLLYDRWPRHAFRLLLFAPEKTPADYEALRLDEDASFAGGVYETRTAAGATAEFVREDQLASPAGSRRTAPQLRAVKQFRFAPLKQGCEVSCDVTLSHTGGRPLRMAVGIESIVNLLAPNEPDRFIETSTGRHPLCWSGAAPASTLRLTDGWQKLRVTLEAPEANEFWVAPIETVSESEEGFERVYQGSQILAVWQAGIVPEKPWSARLVWRIESL